MAMQTIRLYLDPGTIADVAHACQLDVRRQFKFLIFDENGAYTIPSGSSLSINGQKSDGYIFNYTESDMVGSDHVISKSGNQIFVSTTQQMTAAVGNVECQIRISKEGQDIGILPFTMYVQKTPLANEEGYSKSELPSIVQKYEEMTEDAEAWARGTRNGTSVPSSDETYHNNSKYYFQQASSSATTASNKATEASNKASQAASSATTASNKASEAASSASTASSKAAEATTQANKAKTEADRAQSYSVNTPYIGSNGNWWVWNNTQGKYVDSGVDASITVTIADITMLEPTESPRVTNTGTKTDPIFHLFIPRGKGIASIAKTGTSGLVDTYTITYSDGAKTTFQVTNGKSITSITKTGTSGLVDTYTITYNVGEPTTFQVTNGKTAYQSAVEGGYTGTEAEFESDLKNFKVLSATAKNSASNAATSEANALAYKNEAGELASNAEASKDRAVLAETYAATSASNALANAREAEAWAVGQRNGVDVSSGDDTYENNSKYYAGLSKEIKDFVAEAWQEMEAYYRMMLAVFGRTEINLAVETGDSLITEDGNNIIVDY